MKEGRRLSSIDGESRGRAAAAGGLRGGAAGRRQPDRSTSRSRAQSAAYFELASDAQLDWISPIAEWAVENADVRIAVGAEHQHPRALAGRRPSADARARRRRSDADGEDDGARAPRASYRWALHAVPDPRLRVRGGDVPAPTTRTSTTAPASRPTPTRSTAWERAVGGDQAARRVDRGPRGGPRHRRRAPTSRSASPAARSSPATASTTCPTASSSPARSRTRSRARSPSTCRPATAAARSPACASASRAARSSTRRAERGEEFLIEMLDTDEGARRLGELGIGTNYGIAAGTERDPARREDRRHRPHGGRQSATRRPAASTSPPSTGTWSATSARAAASPSTASCSSATASSSSRHRRLSSSPHRNFARSALFQRAGSLEHLAPWNACGSFPAIAKDVRG